MPAGTRSIDDDWEPNPLLEMLKQALPDELRSDLMVFAPGEMERLLGDLLDSDLSLEEQGTEIIKRIRDLRARRAQHIEEEFRE